MEIGEGHYKEEGNCNQVKQKGNIRYAFSHAEINIPEHRMNQKKTCPEKEEKYAVDSPPVFEKV